MMHSGSNRRRKVVSAVVHKETYTKEDPEVDMGMVTTTDIVEEAVDFPSVLIAVRLVMSLNFAPSCVCFVSIFIVLNM
jgi:hypothetical protein